MQETGKHYEKAYWTNRQKLQYISGIVIITVFVIAGFKYVFPFVAPFVIAYAVAVMIEKPVNRLARVFKGRKMIASAVIVILFSAVLCVGIGLAAYFGLAEIKSFIKNYEYNMVTFRQTAARICFNMDGWLGLSDGQCLDFICRCMEKFEKTVDNGGVSQIMTKVVTISVPAVIKTITVTGSVIICFISVVYLAVVIDNVRDWKKENVFRMEIKAVSDSLYRLIHVYFKIEALILVINSILCIIALLIIKNPYAVVLGILIGIVDMLPVFGTGTVLLPWALFELVNKNVTSAAVLVSAYVVTYFVREIMESKCLGDKTGIPPFVMLMVIFLGIMIYGIMGFILGPVSYCIMKALILHLKIEIERGTLKNT
ncbi:MAG: AI-2E family transporter [Lachnospira sp.]|nr:AI-2E family transporter [Lachnospira sp.]